MAFHENSMQSLPEKRGKNKEEGEQEKEEQERGWKREEDFLQFKFTFCHLLLFSWARAIRVLQVIKWIRVLVLLPSKTFRQRAHFEHLAKMRGGESCRVTELPLYNLCVCGSPRVIVTSHAMFLVSVCLFWAAWCTGIIATWLKEYCTWMARMSKKYSLCQGSRWCAHVLAIVECRTARDNRRLAAVVMVTLAAGRVNCTALSFHPLLSVSHLLCHH